ncbi:POZ domain-containing protein [Ramicandelaber brevisporus]|nr:POZ domain-containing protein [Ramicandelaber brevisporus]
MSSKRTTRSGANTRAASTKADSPATTTAADVPESLSSSSDDSVLSGTVRLISSDGFEFILEKRVAVGAGLIKRMLASSLQFAESVQNEIVLREIKAVLLEKICEYLHYKAQYQTLAGSTPEFPLEPEMALELMVASDFMDC